MKNYISILSIAAVYSLFIGCKASGDYAGREYMPDMAHSKAYEPYSESDVFNNGMSARLPVKGTVARGFIPYTLANSNEGYEQAGATVTSPLSYSEHAAALDKGEHLYNIYCTVCHGEGGEGNGTIVENGKYPPPPSYFRADILALPEGKMFHSMTYGKNLMGSYASQLTQEERWEIVSYVKQMQADHISGKDGISKEAALSQVFKGRGGTIDYVAAESPVSAEPVAVAAAEPAVEPVAAPTAASTPPVAAAAGISALSANAASGTKITLKNVTFNSGSAVLKNTSFPELNNLIKILKANRKMSIEVSGHTDNTGGVQANKALSEARAKKVKDYLVKEGILSTRISSAGYGSAQPVADNNTSAGRALNRRTEVKVK